MQRIWLNFIVDVATGVAVFALVVTGLLVSFVLPPGSGREGLVLLGVDRHGWGDVHFWIAMGVLGLGAVHIGLHWQWICTMAVRTVGKKGAVRPAKRHVAGALTVAAVVVAVTGMLLVAQAGVVRDPAAARESRAAERDGRGPGTDAAPTGRNDGRAPRRRSRTK